jgi:hypothetical protein
LYVADRSFSPHIWEFSNSFQPGEVGQKTQNMLYVNSQKVPINCNVSDFDIEQSAIDLDLDSGMYFPDPCNFVAVMYIEVLYFGRRLLTEKTKMP